MHTWFRNTVLIYVSEKIQWLVYELSNICPNFGEIWPHLAISTLAGNWCSNRSCAQIASWLVRGQGSRTWSHCKDLQRLLGAMNLVDVYNSWILSSYCTCYWQLWAIPGKQLWWWMSLELTSVLNITTGGASLCPSGVCCTLTPL